MEPEGTFDVEIDPTEEPGAGLPQSIPLDPGKLIDQLMRRYGAQLQQQTWENAQLATENDALRTLLAEAQNEQQESASTINQLSFEVDEWARQYEDMSQRAISAERMVKELQSAGMLNGMAEVSSADDPQEADAFRAMASGQPGLGGDGR
jgi:hypothetical protein